MRNRGRPRIPVDADKIAEMRRAKLTWVKIANKLKVSEDTAIRAFRRDYVSVTVRRRTLPSTPDV